MWLPLGCSWPRNRAVVLNFFSTEVKCLSHRVQIYKTNKSRAALNEERLGVHNSLSETVSGLFMEPSEIALKTTGIIVQCWQILYVTWVYHQISLGFFGPL